MSDDRRILFVCQGNIIRSPLAEHMFNHLAAESGVGEKYVTDSAGTSSYHVGERPDSRMRQVAANRGFKYDGRARQFQTSDFDRFDLIIAMDSQNLNILQRQARNSQDKGKLYTMRTFDPEGDTSLSVPDPYYGGINGFEVTYDIVERSVAGFLAALENDEL